MPRVKRGEIWWANLGDSEGSEQRGRRPVLIIQNNVGNHFSPTIIVASITDAKKKTLPTHVHIDQIGKLYKPSVVMLEQIRTIDKRKLDKMIAGLPNAVMQEIDEKIKISFGLVPLPVT